MKLKEFLDDLVGASTDISVLLRELCIVALFCLLFFAPDTFKTLLTRIGISKVSTVFGDIDVASAAGGTVASLDRGLKDSIDRLGQIQSTSSDTQSKADVGKVADYLKSLQQEAETTDQTIKSSIVNQQAAAGTSAPAAKTGWLFAGSTDRAMQHWAGTSNVVPANVSPNFTVNEKFTTIGPGYLRDNFSKGKVIGVVRANTQLQVIAPPQWPESISGGHSCWLQVQVP